MAIRLWGRLSSNNVQKVVWTLEEIGVPYTQIDAGGRFGGLDDPSFRAMNPNAKVPVLRDGDTVIWESHAIVRYLAAAYSAGFLWPKMPGERAIADQWTDWTATTFQPAWIDVFWLFVRTPAPQHDKQAIANALTRAHAAFVLMNQRLTAAPFLGGDTFSYADIVAGVSMYRWMTMEIERPALPALGAWHARLLARPAFHKAVCISYAELAGRLTL